ncbi:MAG: hypothetical protein CHACPFDD_04120 [Phycisphaerae bacterium]|nr:hypothetical protein [Phycisphaerae bacterium]
MISTTRSDRLATGRRASARVARWFGALLAVPLAACHTRSADTAPAGDERSNSPPTQPTHALRPAPWDTTQGTGVLSNGGRYYVAYRTKPDAIPLNESFVIEVCVCDAAKRDTLVPGVQLLAEARMPEHDHGMNVSPSVTLRPDGAYEVSGMLLHMAGFWEVYFDVTRGGITERAQLEVHLD